MFVRKCILTNSGTGGHAVATNLDIDLELIDKAIRLGGKKTKKAVVNEALEEYIRRREQMKVFELFGKIEVDPDYDYKDQRGRK